MSARRITVSEVLAAAAFVLATFGVSFALYRLVAEFREGTIVIGLSGWNYAFGVLAWLMVLLSAGAVVAPRINRLPGAGRRALPFVTAALGILALVFVVVAFADKPGETEFGNSVVESIDRDELMGIAGRAMGWESVGTGIGYGAGPFLLLIAALLTLAAAALLLAGRGSAESRADAADRTVSPPAARSSGTCGEWRPSGADQAGSEAGPAAPVAAAPSVGASNVAPPVVASTAAADARGAVAAPSGGVVDPWAAARAAGGGSHTLPAAAAPAAAASLGAAGPKTDRDDVADATVPLGAAADRSLASAGESPAAAATDPAATPAAAVFCVRCGTRYGSSDERFCTRCGASRPGV